MSKVTERFFRYISVDTQSSEESDTFPSTEKQFTLCRMLADEMKEMGVSNVRMDEEHCYVYGEIPANTDTDRTLGFISHMDTAPDFSGENIKPQMISDYDGKDVLLAGSGDYLKLKDFPSLAALKGRTLITTDGTTLLGADDKAGIAEILTAIEEITTEQIPHGDLWIGFTPDEEIGCGADLFDLNIFQADYAYTVDGDYEGEVAYENFNAASATFHIKGVNVHPGEAKDIMINAALVGCEIVSLLPADETPAHTSGREGFYHLTHFNGTVGQAKLTYILRDHDSVVFADRHRVMEQAAKYLNEKYGEGRVKLTIKEQYKNMAEIICQYPETTEKAKAAIKAAGLEPEVIPVRGGTDGAVLSFMGLPCPNLGTGGHAFHGPFEHITTEAMDKGTEIIVELVKEYAK